MITNRKERGQASLMMMLIALAVTLILARGVYESVLTIQRVKNENQAISSVQGILATVNSYHGINGVYPNTTQFAVLLNQCTSCSPWLSSEFIAGFPATPTNSNYTYSVSLPTGSTQGQAYLLIAQPTSKSLGVNSYCVGANQTTWTAQVHQKVGIATPASVLDCDVNWAPVVTSTQQGPAGPPGPVTAYTTTTPLITTIPTTCGYDSCGVVHLAGLPAGSYVVTATVSYNFPTTATQWSFIGCSNVQGGGSGVAQSSTNSGGTANPNSLLVLSWKATGLPANSTLTMYCGGGGNPAAANVNGVSMQAIAVTSVVAS